MTKTTLIIDIGRDAVRAGLFSAKTLAPCGFFSHPIDRSDGRERGESAGEALSALLATVKEKGVTTFYKILVGIPAGDMTLRVLPLPFEEREKIKEVLPFEMGGLLPRGAEEMIIDGIPLGEGKVLAVAVEKGVLREYLDTLNGCGLDPYWLGTPLFSLEMLLREVNKDHVTTGLILEDSMTVASSGKVHFLKPLSGIDGIKLSACYLDSEGVRVENCYVTGWDREEVATIFPSSTIETLTLPFDYPAEGAGLLSLALHLKGGMEGGINFRRGEFVYTQERKMIKKNLTVTAILVAMIMGFVIGDFSLRYMSRAREVATVRESLRDAYRNLFPKEGKVVDELYQLEGRVKEVNEKLEVIGGGLDVLEILTRVALAGKEGGGHLTLHKLSMGEGRLTAKGEVASFEGATRVRDLLRKDALFGEVRLTDVTAGGDGKTHFSLTMSIK